ncbi:MAG TPA: hypothetical protein VNH82_05775 [Candidatus Dormibacteraeota bacterium]|nr:hypothetical protein [Candidatus Dormibacteraeota bacterium]
MPRPDAPLMEILDFGLTYNAYEHHGGFAHVAALAQRTRRRWEETGAARVRLSTARAALFFEQRSLHWTSTLDEPIEEGYVRALVDRIREVSYDMISGPTEPEKGDE